VAAETSLSLKPKKVDPMIYSYSLMRFTQVAEDADGDSKPEKVKEAIDCIKEEVGENM
jgi:hypothetical protein